ncbi:ATP-binding protein [Galactobacter caseinivorans]|uniref:histidine kinase n=1 Tax=Galactobacter caseinivorans TaxID=2676123 RepID=A0A496PG85_9MICC|nr:ATP-binding protein [Galactobacter caseinivorans]RKW69388.1 sensor histidine kinase KdpD [Galactobacter caseinivorans]
MSPARLRVYLGAAPGVGKTFAMLEQAQEWAAQGRDVAVGLVETHGRAATAALVSGLEVIPRRASRHRGVELQEMDVDAILARHPEVVLVDELAHSNAPGSAHAKRWQDVRQILDAGIDVLSTVNVQHLESLSDVVAAITGVRQQETVPDDVVRGAERVELVDLDPSALRERLSAGHVYPAERVDAALAHYFRLGNLTGLRELALLWMADGVDAALRDYRRDHGIGKLWATRERVVVSLTGGPEGQTLLRRGARIAARTAGGELLAVYVNTQDGSARSQPTELASQRELLERLGGSYHEVRGDDVPAALVEFARGADATQLVLGASRRGRWRAALTGPGIGATVVREAGDIDVHLVNHAAAAGLRSSVHFPKSGVLSRRRMLAGFGLAALGGPLLTWGMSFLQGDEALVAHALIYQLLVVAVAMVGGWWPALLTAVLSGISLDFFFVAPISTVSIAAPIHALALALYVVNGLLVSGVVDRAARRARVARRAAAESELLAYVAAGAVEGDAAVPGILGRTREALGADGVALESLDGAACVVADGASSSEGSSGGSPEGASGSGGSGGSSAARDRVPEDAARERVPQSAASEPVGTQGALRVWGVSLSAADQRLLHAVAGQLAASLENTQLQKAALDTRVVAEADRVRTALLNAVGHDLRRPLAAAVTSLGALRLPTVRLSKEDRAELLETASEALETLTDLVTNLLDVSRLQAGALGVVAEPTEPADVALAALDELGLGPAEVRLVWPEDSVQVRADPVLLQRVLVNLLANALRYQPEGEPVRLGLSRFGDEVELRVVDTGPGIEEERRARMFEPFQRLGDTDNSTGLGLGLAVARGFTQGMGGTLAAEDTPGGGLTMVVTLPSVTAHQAPAQAGEETRA